MRRTTLHSSIQVHGRSNHDHCSNVHENVHTLGRGEEMNPNRGVAGRCAQIRPASAVVPGCFGCVARAAATQPTRSARANGGDRTHDHGPDTRFDQWLHQTAETRKMAIVERTLMGRYQ